MDEERIFISWKRVRDAINKDQGTLRGESEWRTKAILGFIDDMVKIRRQKRNIPYGSNPSNLYIRKYSLQLIDRIKEDGDILRIDALVYLFFSVEALLKAKLSVSEKGGRTRFRNVLFDKGQLLRKGIARWGYSLLGSYAKLKFDVEKNGFNVEERGGVWKHLDEKNATRYIVSATKYLSRRAFNVGQEDIEKHSGRERKYRKNKVYIKKMALKDKGLIVTWYDVLWGYSESLRYHLWSVPKNINVHQANENIALFYKFLLEEIDRLG